MKPTLKYISETETENSHRRDLTKRPPSNVNVLLETKVHELESRNSSLEWKIKALAISMTVLSVCLLGTLIFSVVNELNNEDLSDFKTQVWSDQWKGFSPYSVYLLKMLLGWSRYNWSSKDLKKVSETERCLVRLPRLLVSTWINNNVWVWSNSWTWTWPWHRYWNLNNFNLINI